MVGPGANRAWCAPVTMVHTMKRLQEDRALARKATKRRQYDAAFKRCLVELSLVPGASVAKIALDHRLNANILFEWRRYHLRQLARTTSKPAAELLPVMVLEAKGAVVPASAPAQRSSSASRRRTAMHAGGVIEIDWPLAHEPLTGVVSDAFDRHYTLRSKVCCDTWPLRCKVIVATNAAVHQCSPRVYCYDACAPNVRLACAYECRSCCTLSPGGMT